MNHSYSIKIEYSPAYELVVSFYVYIYHNHLKNVVPDHAWRQETERKLPASFARELEDERWEVLHRMVLLISQAPAKETAEDFLHWLERLPAGEIYERLAPWVESIPLNLGEIRDRSLYLLSAWNEHYFRHLPPEIMDRLRADARKQEQAAAHCAPIDLIEQATNGLRIEPTANLNQVILVPQYHCAGGTVLDFFRGIATCLYPVRLSVRPAEPLLQMAQCLADEKRLAILRLLARKNCTLGELQQEIGLAKSTVHHHITALRRAGMIRSHFLDHTTPAYYSLRSSFIDRLHGELRRFFDEEVPRS
ncbi:winged helix-turn-helix transcriptional regulator [Brevibacillus sp. SYP-B805]|uniref:ArsR/SmtB family transcription factor n=1 Tax=Brevibacillus sp. SYP-B805 TaxID=1578199 RepID=UPI0013E9D73D|nr:winged helix-turn-helix domain-containing protein [Brevibacillus sp. SYP-B805]NGQ94157.1 winged helix-turn-helix transcriptional regulator [Brevibacillus sp. SYP-B805]